MVTGRSVTFVGVVANSVVLVPSALVEEVGKPVAVVEPEVVFVSGTRVVPLLGSNDTGEMLVDEPPVGSSSVKDGVKPDGVLVVVGPTLEFVVVEPPVESGNGNVGSRAEGVFAAEGPVVEFAVVEPPIGSGNSSSGGRPEVVAVDGGPGVVVLAVAPDGPSVVDAPVDGTGPVVDAVWMTVVLEGPGRRSVRSVPIGSKMPPPIVLVVAGAVLLTAGGASTEVGRAVLASLVGSLAVEGSLELDTIPVGPIRMTESVDGFFVRVLGNCFDSVFLVVGVIVISGNPDPEMMVEDAALDSMTSEPKIPETISPSRSRLVVDDDLMAVNAPVEEDDSDLVIVVVVFVGSPVEEDDSDVVMVVVVVVVVGLPVEDDDSDVAIIVVAFVGSPVDEDDSDVVTVVLM